MEEVLAIWVTDPQGRYLDGTVGGAGHAEALLTRFPETTLIGFDRDPEALQASRERLAPFGARVQLTQTDIGDVADVLRDIGGEPVMGILFDLGVSSRQIDRAERGFSYLAEGPLRMTLDRDAEFDLARFLQEQTLDSLTTILQQLGELSGARRAARCVLEARDAGVLTSTHQLADALRRGGLGSPKRLSQAFQALRLSLNHELESLDRALEGAAEVLPAGGVLAVISFESLMDRRVKRAFRPPRTDRPVAGIPDPLSRWEVITRGAVRPGDDELARNVRSRSARLRAARRTEHD